MADRLQSPIAFTGVSGFHAFSAHRVAGKGLTGFINGILPFDGRTIRGSSRIDAAARPRCVIGNNVIQTDGIS
jgi:hypothetical protein